MIFHCTSYELYTYAKTPCWNNNRVSNFFKRYSFEMVVVRAVNCETSVVCFVQKLWFQEDFCDVTLRVGLGQEVQGHQLLLAACSPVLKDLLLQSKQSHPVILLPDVSFLELKKLMAFLYMGEVKVTERKLQAFFELALQLNIIVGPFPPSRRQKRKKCVGVSSSQLFDSHTMCDHCGKMVVNTQQHKEVCSKSPHHKVTKQMKISMIINDYSREDSSKLRTLSLGQQQVADVFENNNENTNSCEKEFSLSTLPTSYRPLKPKKIKCDQCKKVFPANVLDSVLRNHIMMTHTQVKKKLLSG